MPPAARSAPPDWRRHGGRPAPGPGSAELWLEIHARQAHDDAGRIRRPRATPGERP